MRDKNTRALTKTLTRIFLLLLLFAGCLNTQTIQVTVTNTSTEELSTIEITYPEASFGINSLEAGKSFHYKIKPTSTGPIKIGFFNARGANRIAHGPVVHKNQEGAIEIKLTQEGASVSNHLR